MDTSKQLHEQQATGWKRGVYDDIKRTFRAPFINWIFRTTMANHPAFLRHAWAQVKPIFDTRGFARFSVRYRDTVLSTLETEHVLPTYRREDLGVRPPEYREIQHQLETFDIVGPRLAVLFMVVDRTLHDEPVGAEPEQGRSATAPFPDWLDADRGAPPTMIGFEEIPDELDDVVPAIQAFHGFDEGLPSIYRCLAQWPELLGRQWEDLEPVLESDAFERACTESRDLLCEYVASVPYQPRLMPADLERFGLGDDVIGEVQALFEGFNSGPVETVLPALPVYAQTVDAEGYRGW